MSNKTTMLEPMKVPSTLPTGTEYSVEPHGNGYAIYQGRDQFHHGLNLAHLTECTPEFSKRIESALNETREPVKVPSDEDIERLASEHLSAHAQFVDAGEVYYEGEVAFARALLARYGHPVAPEGWHDTPH